MEDYQDRLVVATPEGVELAFALAGLGSRFTAGLIDLFIKLVIITAILVPLLSSDSAPAGVAALAVPLLVYIGYDVLFETLGSGRTPGKRATGLRVLRADGGSEDVVSSLIRNVLRLIDGLPLSYVPGIVSILVTRRNQRIGDLAAGTIVVRERAGGRRRGERGAVPSFATDDRAIAGEAAAETGSVTFAPPVPAGPSEADLGGLDADGLGVVRGFLERRDQLDPGARAELARRLADAVRPRVAGPFEGLEPEAFLEAVDAARRR